MIELECPYCKEDHEIPEDCVYGGEFTAPCGNVVEVAYDEQYDEETLVVYSWYLLYKSKKDRVTITSTPLTSRSILTEFSKLGPPLELDVEAAARSREKTRALLDSIVTKMEVVHTPPDAPRLAGAWTCEIEVSSEVVGLPDNGGG